MKSRQKDCLELSVERAKIARHRSEAFIREKEPPIKRETEGSIQDLLNEALDQGNRPMVL